MNKHTDHLNHAKALQADILASPDVWLPRREILLDWLTGFLRRATVKSYELGESEASDLTALDQFLRKRKVPVAAA
jgi:hypothetical protein